MGIESLTIAAQAAGFSMVARDDTELGELKNRETERGLTLKIGQSEQPLPRWVWPFRLRSNS